MNAAAESFSPEDRAAMLAEYDRLLALPQPVNKTSAGCALLLLAFVLFIAAPFVLRRVPSLRIGFFVVEGILVLIGLYWNFFGMGGSYARASIGAESALAMLTKKFNSASAQERHNAAVYLVASAYYSDGPSTTTTFEFDEARAQLGPALPYMIAVEQFLIAERGASPVFTLPPPDGTPH